jgi:rhomboid-like protein
VALNRLTAHRAMNLLLGIAPIRPLLPSIGHGLCRSSGRPIICSFPATRQLSTCLHIAPRRHNPQPAQRSPLCLSNYQRQRNHPFECQRTVKSPSPYKKATGPSGIYTNYEDLPPDYRDQDGLDFRHQDLTHTEFMKIFGSNSGIKLADARYLLRVLHGRRVAGTLEEPIYFYNTARFTEEAKQKALEFLRKARPVDETYNAGLRAQDELVEMEEERERKELIRRGLLEEDMPKYKPDPVYGPSVIDQIRHRNEHIAEKEEKARLEEEAQARAAEALAPAGSLELYEQKFMRNPSPRMKKWLERARSELREPPKMPISERLGPTTAFVMLLTGVCVVVAMYYKAPRIGERIFPEIPPAAATILALIAMNVAVWVAWKIPPFWGAMNQYFILVHALPRAWGTVFTQFSHQKLGHLVGNMVGLWFFGTRLHDDVGRGAFLGIYLSSGAIGFLGSLYYHVIWGTMTFTTIGASGAVYGVAMAWFWLHKTDYFRIFGLPQPPSDGIPGGAFIGFMVGLHIASLFSSTIMTSVDILSHMWGMVGGLVWAEWWQRRKEKEKQRLTVDLWYRSARPVEEQRSKDNSPREREAKEGK